MFHDAINNVAHSYGAPLTRRKTPKTSEAAVDKQRWTSSATQRICIISISTSISIPASCYVNVYIYLSLSMCIYIYIYIYV